MGVGSDLDGLDDARSLDSAGLNVGAQTALLLRLSAEKQEPHRGQDRRSVIKINPNISWPILGDDDQKVDRCIRKFESTIGLAKDGRGTQPSEKLITMGQCLRQSRLKVYELLVERAERSGKYAEDPQGVYNEVVVRLLEFSVGRRGCRRIGAALGKGASTACSSFRCLSQLLTIWTESS